MERMVQWLISAYQTERLVEKYQQTLKLHQKGRLSEAKTKYEEIADTDLVKNGTKTEHLQTRSIHITTLSMLRFLVFKNYASILEDEYEMSEMKNADVAKEALQYYLQALKIDPTEYSLWYRAGRIAQTLGNNRFARHAFQTGLFMDASQGQSAESTTTYHTQVNWEQKMENFLKCGRINPIQWQCMEGLCNVLFDIGDFNICHFYVELGLRHFPDWVLGKKLKHDMEIPTLAESMDYISESVEKPSEKAYLSINIQKLTWPDLAKELLGRFSDMTIESTSHESTVDTNSDYTNLYERIPFISKSLHINVISTEETVVARASPPLESAPAFATIPDSTTLPTPIAEQMQNPVHTETTTVPIPLIVIDEEDNDHDIATKAATSTESQMDIDHSLKRKRGEEDGVEGNAEENEAEEKRASLRASKRQREKVENEETWRRKMLQEETELSDKMQKLLDKLSPVTYLQCKEPWYIPVEELYDDTPIESFWEWFDAKVSELDRTYTWNIDKFQLQDALSCSTSSNQRRRYAIFEKSRLQPSSASNEHMDSAVLNFVQALNTNNCGIIDGLCQLAMTLLKCDNSTGLDGPLAETMVDIIIALEHNFFNMIAHDTLYDSTDDSKTEVTLPIAHEC
ncbi:Calcineurin-binding protein cabin-1 [Apophysomyces sp. BC1034]|nr:Calcineurin-binding protein cabin-1 [Apophysomyces sp. BC1021]KAG0194109.1 Calcineurin-binding protein cabin-1 [Apophysomyces sp. BC1034]